MTKLNEVGTQVYAEICADSLDCEMKVLKKPLTDVSILGSRPTHQHVTQCCMLMGGSTDGW
jgi:hypothetical protein